MTVYAALKRRGNCNTLSLFIKQSIMLLIFFKHFRDETFSICFFSPHKPQNSELLYCVNIESEGKEENEP